MAKFLGWLLGGLLVLLVQWIIFVGAAIKRYPTNPLIWLGVLLPIGGVWAGIAWQSGPWLLTALGAFVLTPLVIWLVDRQENARFNRRGRGRLLQEEAIDYADEDDDWLRPPLAA